MFSRKKDGKDNDKDNSSSKAGGWRRPANTAFKQQRLKAWQPILTPKTVLPTLFVIAVVFGPIGGLLIWGSSLVSQITIDYTGCDSLTASPNNSLTFTPLDSDKYSYSLRSEDAHLSPSSVPSMAFVDQSTVDGIDPSQKKLCYLHFNVPANLQHPVFLYYRLDNFFQNHRRYVKSFNSDQLKGSAVPASTLANSDCNPLGSTPDNKAIYPCGLIANSVFNDTFGNLTLQNPPGGGQATTYNFTSNGIAWEGESKKYAKTPLKGDDNPNGYDSVDQIVPPPNWHDRYPDGYTVDNVPNLQNDFHFQNWMRTAGLPTFSKLYGRNDDDDMETGDYELIIGMNFPVTPYKGSKAIVISTVSWIGGKNPFLGWAYVGTAGLFVLLAIAGTARHLIKPRRLGDMSLLSWNR